MESRCWVPNGLSPKGNDEVPRKKEVRLQHLNGGGGMWLLYIPGRVENVEMCLHTWKRSTVSVVINLEEKK